MSSDTKTITVGDLIGHAIMVTMIILAIVIGLYGIGSVVIHGTLYDVEYDQNGNFVPIGHFETVYDFVLLVVCGGLTLVAIVIICIIAYRIWNFRIIGR